MTISYPKQRRFEGTLFIFFKPVVVFHSKDQETLQQ
jgi:hypothetical protein